MLIDALPSILALTAVQMVGLISPGPDFAVVVRNSLVYSRKTGLWTATGIALGTMIHLTYILLGVGLFIEENPFLFHLFKYVGAGYLIYVGSKGLLAKKHALDYGDTHHRKCISSLVALRTGFLTSALNPKAMLFFLSILSAFLTPHEPPLILFIYGVIIVLTTILWFMVVAIGFSHKQLRILFNNCHHWVERVTGALLTLLGVGMLFVEAF